MSSQRERIAERAHELWVRRGRPIGSPEIDWAAAEQELAEESGETTPAKAAARDSVRQAIDVLTNDSDRGPVATETKGPPPADESSPSENKSSTSKPSSGGKAGGPTRPGKPRTH